MSCVSWWEREWSLFSTLPCDTQFRLHRIGLSQTSALWIFRESLGRCVRTAWFGKAPSSWAGSWSSVSGNLMEIEFSWRGNKATELEDTVRKTARLPALILISVMITSYLVYPSRASGCLKEEVFIDRILTVDRHCVNADGKILLSETLSLMHNYTQRYRCQSSGLRFWYL